MGQESCDDFFSGQAAALAGGTTMHIDFALPVNGNLLAGYEQWRRKAAKSCMDHGFHMAVTTWNDEVARDMEVLVSEKGQSIIRPRVCVLGKVYIWRLQVKKYACLPLVFGQANLLHIQSG